MHVKCMYGLFVVNGIDSVVQLLSSQNIMFFFVKTRSKCFLGLMFHNIKASEVLCGVYISKSHIINLAVRIWGVVSVRNGLGRNRWGLKRNSPRWT